MSDVEDPTVEKRLSRKEFLKEQRRKQYQIAKEQYKNSDYAKAAKERQREYRKEQYQRAKDAKKKRDEAPMDSAFHVVEPVSRRQNPPDQVETKSLRDEGLWDQVLPASTLRPKLRLIKNTD